MRTSKSFLFPEYSFVHSKIIIIVFAGVHHILTQYHRAISVLSAGWLRLPPKSPRYVPEDLDPNF